jgi:hypothetical protein
MSVSLRVAAAISPAGHITLPTMHARYSLRYLSSISPSLSSRVPWFVDSSEALLTQRASSQKGTQHPLPPGVPLALQILHAQLAQSPHLEPSKLLVRDPIPHPPGPPLPLSTPKGRRRRGSTYAGEGILEPGSIWNWIVLAEVQPLLYFADHIETDDTQVKEGTEKRGAIESLIRLVRKTVRQMCQSIDGDPY